MFISNFHVECYYKINSKGCSACLFSVTALTHPWDVLYVCVCICVCVCVCVCSI